MPCNPSGLFPEHAVGLHGILMILSPTPQCQVRIYSKKTGVYVSNNEKTLVCLAEGFGMMV